MKNNIMVFVVVTLVVLGVIITVIIASVANGHQNRPPIDSSNNPGYASSENSNSAQNSGDSFSLPFSDSQTSSDVGGFTIGDAIVNTARSILEREEKVPFAENGASLEGFDNSGFIYYVLLENGFTTCPRGLQEQTAFGSHLEYDKLKPGDLVFFYNEDNTSQAGYGGIYTGSGTMIACLDQGKYVEEINISSNYFREHFCCGVSLS